MGDLVRAIAHNFEGDEALRQLLINKPPKYGNDDPEGRNGSQTHWWAEEAATCTTPKTAVPRRIPVVELRTLAPRVSATPDGRKRGTYLITGSPRCRAPTATAYGGGKMVGNLN